MEIPGFYFCLCPDSTLAREHVDALIKKMETLVGIWEISTFWAEEGLDNRFWESLTLQGLTDRPRVLMVRGAQNLPADTWKKLSALLGTPRSGILPIFFLESAWEKGQPKLPAHVAKLRCLDFAGQKGWIWRSPGLEARSLRKHVQERAAFLGLRLAPDALEALCEIVTPDAAAVRGVLDQLSLASGDGPADAALVRQMTEHAPELIIFDFIRHLQTGNTVEVWKTLLREGDGGEALLFPLLGLLTRETRLLWQIQAGENVWMPQSVAGMKRALASRLGTTGLSGVFTAVMEAEWAVKSGRRQPLQALEELVGSLTMVFGADSGEARNR